MGRLFALEDLELALLAASAAEIEQSLHCPEPQCMDRWRAAFSEALARDLIKPDDFKREARDG